MSNEIDKEKHSERLHKEKVKIAKQVKIAKASGLTDKEIQPHKYAKKHAMDCGNPGCVVCGNPRKIFKEKTIQEQRAEQMKVQDE